MIKYLNKAAYACISICFLSLLTAALCILWLCWQRPLDGIKVNDLILPASLVIIFAVSRVILSFFSPAHVTVKTRNGCVRSFFNAKLFVFGLMYDFLRLCLIITLLLRPYALFTPFFPLDKNDAAAAQELFDKDAETFYKINEIQYPGAVLENDIQARILERKYVNTYFFNMFHISVNIAGDINGYYEEIKNINPDITESEWIELRAERLKELIKRVIEFEINTVPLTSYTKLHYYIAHTFEKNLQHISDNYEIGVDDDITFFTNEMFFLTSLELFFMLFFRILLMFVFLTPVVSARRILQFIISKINKRHPAYVY